MEPDPNEGVRLIVKGGAILCAAAILALHFWVSRGESADVCFLIALLFLTAIALSG